MQVSSAYYMPFTCLLRLFCVCFSVEREERRKKTRHVPAVLVAFHVHLRSACTFVSAQSFLCICVVIVFIIILHWRCFFPSSFRLTLGCLQTHLISW